MWFDAVHLLTQELALGTLWCGEAIGDSLVWFAVHPLAALPAAILLMVKIARA